MNIRRRLLSISLVLSMTAIVSRADPSVDQLKAMYEDSQRQLAQSQDRKNELANENEQLRKRVADLEAELRTVTLQAKQTQFLRNQAALWVNFMKQYPVLLKRFDSYLGGDSSEVARMPAVQPIADLYDPHWPFSALGRIDE
jgi:cell division protein FtsB